MVDIAELSIGVDTSGLERGKKAASEFTDALVQAFKAGKVSVEEFGAVLDKLSVTDQIETLQKLGKTTEEAVEIVKQASEAYKDETEGVNATAQAHKSLGDELLAGGTAAQTFIDKFKEGKVTVEEFGAALEKLSVTEKVEVLQKLGLSTDEAVAKVKKGTEAYKENAIQVGATGEAHKALSTAVSATGGFFSDLASSLFGYGHATEQTKEKVVEHGHAHSATAEAVKVFRESLHSLHPALSAAGVKMGELTGFSMAARGGLIGLAAAIAGAVVVEIVKAGDEIDKLHKRFNDTFGVTGPEMFEQTKHAAEELNVSMEKLAPTIDTTYSALRRNQLQQQVDLKKELEAGGMRFAQGPAGDAAAQSIAALNMSSLATDDSKIGKEIKALSEIFAGLGQSAASAQGKASEFFASIPKTAEQAREAAVRATADFTKMFEVSGKGGDDAAKATEKFFSEIKKGGLTSSTFDAIASQSRETAKVIAEAFGYTGPEAVEKFGATLDRVGKLTFSEFIAALNNSHEKIEEMKIPESVAASWSNLKNEFSHLFEVLAEGAGDEGKGATYFLDKITKSLKDAEPGLLSFEKAVIATFDRLGKEAKALVDAFNTVKGWWEKINDLAGQSKNEHGEQTPTGIEPIDWFARKAATSVSNAFEGMMNGPGGSQHGYNSAGWGGDPYTGYQSSLSRSSVEGLLNGPGGVVGVPSESSASPATATVQAEQQQFETGVAKVGSALGQFDDSLAKTEQAATATTIDETALATGITDVGTSSQNTQGFVTGLSDVLKQSGEGFTQVGQFVSSELESTKSQLANFFSWLSSQAAQVASSAGGGGGGGGGGSGSGSSNDSGNAYNGGGAGGDSYTGGGGGSNDGYSGDGYGGDPYTSGGSDSSSYEADIGGNATGGIYTIGATGGTASGGTKASGTDSIKLRGTVSPGEVIAVIPADKANRATLKSLEAMINESPISIGGGNVSGVADVNTSELVGALVGGGGAGYPSSLSDPEIKDLLKKIAELASSKNTGAAAAKAAAAALGPGMMGGGGINFKDDPKKKPPAEEQAQRSPPPQQQGGGAPQTSRAGGGGGGAKQIDVYPGANAPYANLTPASEYGDPYGTYPGSPSDEYFGAFASNSYDLSPSNYYFDQYSAYGGNVVEPNTTSYGMPYDSYYYNPYSAGSTTDLEMYPSAGSVAGSWMDGNNYNSGPGFDGLSTSSTSGSNDSYGDSFSYPNTGGSDYSTGAYGGDPYASDSNVVDIGANASGGVYAVGGPGSATGVRSTAAAVGTDTIQLTGMVSPGEVVAVIPASKVNETSLSYLQTMVSGASSDVGSDDGDIGANATGGIYTVKGTGGAEPGYSGETVTKGEVVVVPTDTVEGSTVKDLMDLISNSSINIGGGAGGARTLSLSGDQVKDALAKVAALIAAAKAKAGTTASSAAAAGPSAQGGGGFNTKDDPKKPHQEEKSPPPERPAREASQSGRRASSSKGGGAKWIEVPKNQSTGAGEQARGSEPSIFDNQMYPYGPVGGPSDMTYGAFASNSYELSPSNYYFNPYSAYGGNDTQPTSNSYDQAYDSEFYNPYSAGAFGDNFQADNVYGTDAYGDTSYQPDWNNMFPDYAGGDSATTSSSSDGYSGGGSGGDPYTGGSSEVASSGYDYSGAGYGGDPYTSSGSDYSASSDYAGGDVGFDAGSYAQGGMFVVPNAPGGGTDTVDTRLRLTGGEVVRVLPVGSSASREEPAEVSPSLREVTAGLPEAEQQAQSAPVASLRELVSATATSPIRVRDAEASPSISALRQQAPEAAPAISLTRGTDSTASTPSMSTLGFGSPPSTEMTFGHAAPAKGRDIGVRPDQQSERQGPNNTVHVNVYGASNPEMFLKSRAAIQRGMRLGLS